MARVVPTTATIKDPRPDLEEDSWAWELLISWTVGGGVAFPDVPDGHLGVGLHHLRCNGARLVLEEDNARLILGDCEPLVWLRVKEECLLPKRGELNGLLINLGRLWREREERSGEHLG